MNCWDVGQFSLNRKQKFMFEHLVSQAGGHIVLDWVVMSCELDTLLLHSNENISWIPYTSDLAGNCLPLLHHTPLKVKTSYWQLVHFTVAWGVYPHSHPTMKTSHWQLRTSDFAKTVYSLSQKWKLLMDILDSGFFWCCWDALQFDLVLQYKLTVR